MKFVIAVLLIATASQYRAGMMDQVVANRQSGNAWVGLPEELPQVDGYVAHWDCSRIGETIWIRPEKGEWEEHLIVDCAMPKGTDGAIEWMRTNNIEVEVSRETAARWGWPVGRGIPVEIGIAVPRGLMP